MYSRVGDMLEKIHIESQPHRSGSCYIVLISVRVDRTRCFTLWPGILF